MDLAMDLGMGHAKDPNSDLEMDQDSDQATASP